MFDFTRFLPYHLNRTGVRLANAFSKRLERFDLTLPMWRVMAALWHHGELKINQLIVDTAIEQSTLSRLLVAMEKRDLVTRQRSALDARTVLVKLTPGGQKVTKNLIPWALKLERTAFKDFSKEEIDALYNMLVRIFKNSAELVPE